MVELAGSVDRPMIGWECGNCSEPYNSRSKPDQRMCLACREETVWALPDDYVESMRDTLQLAHVGDELVIVPDYGAAMRGTVTDRTTYEIILDDGDRIISIPDCTVRRPGSGRSLIGDDIHYVERKT